MPPFSLTQFLHFSFIFWLEIDNTKNNSLRHFSTYLHVHKDLHDYYAYSAETLIDPRSWWWHTGYACALAEALYSKVSLFFLVPEGDILSEKGLSKFGKVEFLIKPRGPKTPIHIFALRLAKAFIDSARLDFTGFDFVVSAGSNFCIPPAIIAWTKGIPIVNTESPARFSTPSRAACILQPFSIVTLRAHA